jgi:nitroimidazol reductase NimA-like FMN-containing flavoprotein (pyridoxamine 5'-phosphate oxidase superfamily)
MTGSRPPRQTGMSYSKPRPFARVRRLKDRGAYDPETVYAIFDAATHCHIAHVIDNRPVAMPTLHWRRGDRLYWHGSTASRMINANRAGGEVCVTATLMDGFVLARCGFNHSANYRSAMCFGTPEEIDDTAAKSAALEHFMEHWFPGRWPTLRPPTRKELAATSVMSLPITEASAKLRDGGPHDAAADLAWPVWAGVVPLAVRPGAPIAAADYAGNAKAPVIPRLQRSRGA